MREEVVGFGARWALKVRAGLHPALQIFTPRSWLMVQESDEVFYERDESDAVQRERREDLGTL